MELTYGGHKFEEGEDDDDPMIDMDGIRVVNVSIWHEQIGNNTRKITRCAGCGEVESHITVDCPHLLKLQKCPSNISQCDTSSTTHSYDPMSINRSQHRRHSLCRGCGASSHITINCPIIIENTMASSTSVSPSHSLITTLPSISNSEKKKTSWSLFSKNRP